MIEFLKRGFNFIKKNPGILFSLFLIFIIPFTLYYNLFFVIRSFQKNIDYELQTKALLTGNILGLMARDFISNPEMLQKRIKNLSSENPEIEQLQIILPQPGEKFQILASTNFQEIGQEISETTLTLSWGKDQTIAHLKGREGERFWDVIKPFYDEQGKKIGLISLSFSLKTADELVLRTVGRSYIILLISILIILLLIIQHTRLFKYLALYQKLWEIDKMKDDFIRMAIHELQSPIVAIKGYIEILREEISPLLGEDQIEYLSRITISGERLSELIYDILEVARLEQRRLPFSFQKISPQEIIKESINELRPKVEKKNLQLIFKEKPEKFLIFVDPARLKQVLVNLIDNSIKYTKKGGIEVYTEANEAKKRYYIHIRDSGIGIPAEAQKRLFEKFYRVKTAETADISGTGLGLWIAGEICQRMGGNIFIESLEGVGSKFTICLPLAKI